MSKADRREALTAKFFEQHGLTDKWKELRKLQQEEYDATKKFYTENGRLGRWMPIAPVSVRTN